MKVVGGATNTDIVLELRVNIPLKRRPITRSHDTNTQTRSLNMHLTENHDEALIVQEEPESKAHDDSTTQLETHTHL